MNRIIQLAIALAVTGLFITAQAIECRIIGKTACYQQQQASNEVAFLNSL